MSKKVIVLVFVVLALGVLAVAGWTYHEQPRFCGDMCHLMGSYVESWHGETDLAKAHAEADVTCLECHEPTLTQQVDELIAYVKKDYRTPLKRRRFDNEWCLRCHEHGSWEQIVERTKDYVVDGVAVNPHAPPMTVEEMPGQQPFQCYQCHKMHAESPGIDFCYDCHMSGKLEACNVSGCHGE